MREQIRLHPELLQQYFDVDMLTPELVNRLEVNRAFGSLLFPNALAAFVILGIPLAFGEVIQKFMLLKAAFQEAGQGESRRRPAKQGERLTAIAIGAVAWLVIVCASFFLVSLVITFRFPGQPLLAHWETLAVLVGAVPLFLAVATGLLKYRLGGRICWLVIGLFIAALTAVLAPLALLFSYSRGGALGLGGAFVIAAGMLLFRKRLLRRFSGASLRAAMCGLLAAVLVSGLMAQRESWADAQAPQPKAQNAAKQPPASDEKPAIEASGRDMGIRDLMDPASLKLRFSYWDVGLRMALDNFWAGVGLANFGTAYPKYQYVGAGPVQAAHNDFLQALCETGIFGFITFCAFWGWFFLWGARRIIAEENQKERWFLAGLYTGVLAFVLHACVDFNFLNPALGFACMLQAGLFLARASRPEPAAQRSHGSQLAAVGLLLLIALVMGASLRLFAVDYLLGGRQLMNVGNTQYIRTQSNAAQFLITAPQGAKSKAPKAERAVMIASLIPDRKTLESFGTLYERSKPPRPLAENEPIREQTVLVIRDPKRARQCGIEATDRWLEILKGIDSLFPHHPEIASTIQSGYSLLQQHVEDPHKRAAYILAHLKWAETAVERSPWQALLRGWHAKALFLRGSIEAGPRAAEYYSNGLAEFEKATELFPISVDVWAEYSNALIQYAQALRRANRHEEADVYRHRAMAALDECLGQYERAAEANAGSYRAWREYSEALDRCSLLLRNANRPVDARPFRRKARQMRQKAEEVVRKRLSAEEGLSS